MFEVEFGLAEAYERAGAHKEAEEIFDKCFKSIDGRIGDTQSVKSGFSKRMSIKARNNSVVSYNNTRGKGQATVM